MGLYARYVWPRILDFVMSDKTVAKERSKVIPAAKDTVLEVGIGSGLNLPFYRAEVKQLYGVDPSAGLLEMARERARQVPFPVELREHSAERLPFADESMDTVVVTWALCSIPEPERALREMKRVLKREGQLLFVEHGRSADPGVERWQNRLNPIWRRVSGGCNMNRKIDELVTGAGFKLAELQTMYLPGPRLMTYTYRGVGLAS